MKIRLKFPVHVFPTVILLSCVGIFLQHESFFQCNKVLSRAVSLAAKPQKKPILVLHVGPTKTGTGTIQLYAAVHNALLEKDNIYYLGHDPRSAKEQAKSNVLRSLVQDCGSHDNHCQGQRSSPSCNCTAKWNDLERTLQQQYEQGHSVFCSDTSLNQFLTGNNKDETLIQQFMAMLIDQSWDIRVVVSNRRYFEMVLSDYYNSGTILLPQWPGNGGAEAMPSFSNYLTDTLQKQNQQNFAPLMINNKWKEYLPEESSDIWISNMAKDDEAFPQHFFCNMLPEAKHLCDHLRIQNSNLVKKNPSVDEDVVAYDMLAVAAYHEGLIPKGRSRAQVVQAIEHHAQTLGIQSVLDFPISCLEDTQAAQFLDISLQLESEMLPDLLKNKYLSNNKRATAMDHKERFAQYQRDGRFCSVDTASVLQDNKWRQFFLTRGEKSEDKEQDTVDTKTISSNATGVATTRNRPSSILSLYNCDEGSTVLSEAFREHPHVYSPTWKIEPVNSRLWDMKDINIQLDAIRFLLRLPSNTTTFDLDVQNPIPEAKYEKWVGNAQATYLKAAVCREGHGNKYKWETCMESVMSNLLCNEDNTLDHLILPLRYGFDRACSRYVHSNKTLYKVFSQFKGAVNKDEIKKVHVSEELAEYQRFRQQQYVEEFVLMNDLFRGTCPNGQAHKTKIHVYDYDNAKAVGMQESLGAMFANVGLPHDSGDVNLGRFTRRKPASYCERFFDDESRERFQTKQNEYETWLYSQCDPVTGKYPWCEDGSRTE